MNLDELLDQAIGPVGTPARDRHEREVARLVRRDRRADRLTHWTLRIPIVGSIAYVFWYGLLSDGVRSTCKPRWGSLTFAFLNDGIRPTLWHTWHSIVDPDAGIWPGGAPASAAEARAREWHPEPEPPQTFDHLSAEERKVVGEPGDYGWYAAWREDWADPAMDIYDAI